MEIKELAIDLLVEYENNPRRNDSAVDAVAESIREFGFKVPVIIDKDNVIVAGHTRVRAARQLGLETVPCVVADDLSPEQVRAFRLADNKVGELSSWDFDKLEGELAALAEVDMSVWGFNMNAESAMSFIDDLLENEYAEHKVEQTQFSITFVFENKYKEAINSYIKENGKESIVDMIVEEVQNA